MVTFDNDGIISSWDGRSGPIATSLEAVNLLEDVVGETLEPVPLVAETMQMLQETPSIRDSLTVIGSTKFPLEGSRDSIRLRETNLGRLIADSFLRIGSLHAEKYEIPLVDAALTNTGGIRGT